MLALWAGPECLSVCSIPYVGSPLVPRKFPGMDAAAFGNPQEAEAGGWDPELSYLEDHREALQDALDKYRAAYFSGAEE